MQNQSTQHSDAAPPVPSILVIGDEEAVRGLFRAILEPVGYRIVEAADGREGIRPPCGIADGSSNDRHVYAMRGWVDGHPGITGRLSDSDDSRGVGVQEVGRVQRGSSTERRWDVGETGSALTIGGKRSPNVYQAARERRRRVDALHLVENVVVALGKDWLSSNRCTVPAISPHSSTLDVPLSPSQATKLYPASLLERFV